MKRLIYNTVIIFIFQIAFSCQQKTAKPVTGSTVPEGGTKEDSGQVITRSTGNEIDSNKKSIKAFVRKKIGNAEIVVSYYSPAVRDRVIWGGLVPFDQVWVTGAHSATNITCDHALRFNDILVPAGKYALFTIPGRNEWTFVINKNWRQHLADNYDAAEDLLRISIRPDSLVQKQERLMYDILPLSDRNGQIILQWEKIKLTVPVSIP